MTKETWTQAQLAKLVSWVTRKRSIGLGLVLAATGAFAALASGGVSVEIHGIAGFVEALKFSTGEGLPGHLLSLGVYLAAATWLLGAYMVWSSWRFEQREADLNRVLVVELRGLVDTSDHSLKSAVPLALPGRRIDCLVDVRRLLTGATPNVTEAIKEIEHIRRQVRLGRGDTSREHVRVVVGGVMPVPLLFLAGALLDDEGKALIFDWDRTVGRWRELAEPDDDSRFTITGKDTVGRSSEVVLAVSASYMADANAIAITFPGLPLVHLAKPNPLPNTLWSEENQVALTQQFIEAMAFLANQGVRTVHLVLAASSSLSLRFGMAYDPRNMPSLRCYQRENGHVPPYPWSVEMPSGSQSAAFVSTPQPVVVTT